MWAEQTHVHVAVGEELGHAVLSSSPSPVRAEDLHRIRVAVAQPAAESGSITSSLSAPERCGMSSASIVSSTSRYAGELIGQLFLVDRGVADQQHEVAGHVSSNASPRRPRPAGAAALRGLNTRRCRSRVRPARLAEIARVVGSSVSNRRSLTLTWLPVSGSAASTCRRSCSQPARTVGLSLPRTARAASRRAWPPRRASLVPRSSVIRRRAIRRSDSSWDSPGPRGRCAAQPFEVLHMPRMRWRLYSSCASSTWSCPPRCARAGRRVSGSQPPVRSTTRACSSSSSRRCLAGRQLGRRRRSPPPRPARPAPSAPRACRAEVGARVRSLAMLHDRGGRLHAGRVQQLLHLEQHRVAVPRRAAGSA